MSLNICFCLFQCPGQFFINATVLSDTNLHIFWTESSRPSGPKESVRYQLLMSHLAPIPETPLRQGDFPNARLALLVTNLSGGQLYVLKVLRGCVSWELLVIIVTHIFWRDQFFFLNKKVLACRSEEMCCTESHAVTVNMIDTPEKPFALVPDNTSLQLDWKAPSNVNLTRFWFELQKEDFWCKSLFYDVQ